MPNGRLNQEKDKFNAESISEQTEEFDKNYYLLYLII